MDDLVCVNIQILTTQQGNLLVVIASSSLANAQHCSDSIAIKAGVFKLVEKGFCPVIKAPNMLAICLAIAFMSMSGCQHFVFVFVSICICVFVYLSL